MRAMAIVGDFGLDHLKLIEKAYPNHQRLPRLAQTDYNSSGAVSTSWPG